MKSVCKDMLMAVFMGMILPGILLNAAVMVLERKEKTETIQVLAAQEPQWEKLTIRILDPDGSTEERDMDDYLVGVVLAEMPASFEIEALKAQAVAARTYARKAGETGGKHGDGSVCMRAGCCQAYITEEDYLSKGGTLAGIEKIRSAVNETRGLVLTYDGELIEATYFSCSGGRTEDAAAVWGTDFPYLRAVTSPGEETADGFVDAASFTPQEFQNALGTNLEGKTESWFGETTYTDGGGVEKMEIGGRIYTGTQLRSLLKLRSTAFSVSVSDENIITITTKGYGHRVGMSQYGADAMAVSGSSYEAILAHYYPGTQISKVSPGS